MATKLKTCILGSVLHMLSSASVYATIIPIDLNDFFFSPGDPVVVAPDGSSATISEDPVLSSILLTNDPGFGDPNVIIPGVGTNLLFDFQVTEPVGNDDNFFVYVLDAATTSSAGAAFEFFADSSTSGTVSFDLTSLVGLTLGLEFQLNANLVDGAFDSTVIIENLRLITPMPVPEPATATLALLGLGIAGLGFRSKRK